MLESIKSLDQKLFLWLNSLHTPALDPVMAWITGTKEWVPFYLLLVVFLIWKYKWKTIYMVVGIALLITACDQFTSTFMKPYFSRLRPCHNPEIQGLIHLVKGCGGKYGFASSHAANTFGLATFFWLILRDRFPWAKYFFIWALIVSYSRIYIGVHYPADVITGGLIGIIFGYLIFKIYEKTAPQNSLKNRKFRTA